MTSDTASISDPQFHAIRLLQGRKAFTASLKPIYKTPTEEVLPRALDELERIMSAIFPEVIKFWRDQQDELTTM